MRFIVFLIGITLARSAFAQDGAAIYTQHCAQCHGQDLRGGNAQSMVDGVWQFGDGKGYVRRNISNGIPQLGMPGYDETLSNDEIEAVTDYILSRENEAAPEEPIQPEEIQTLEYHVKVDLWLDDIDEPWAITFPDEDVTLVTQLTGELRIVRGGELEPEPVSGTPEVLYAGQGGLMDVAVDPNYAENGWVYLSFSHSLPSENERVQPDSMTKIVRGRIQNNRWVDEETVFEAPHDTYLKTRHHYGNRIVFGPEGHLYFSIGDRGMQNFAQDLSRPNGKIHRVWPDGRIPDDNPFVNVEDALPSIYSYGHRNPQGMSIQPAAGTIWASEHGPMGGDELNVVRKAANYGWPEITYGLNYNGAPVSDKTRAEGFEQPTLYYRPSIAVCGIEFIRGGEFPLWDGKLLVGALKYEEVILTTIAGDRVIHQETILKNAGRVRDIGVDPADAIYIVTEQPGRIWRLTQIRERKYR